jgi:hypothetical protein
MRMSGLAPVIAASRGTRFSSGVSVSWMKILPSASTVMTTGSSGSLIREAWVLGKSTGTPTVSSGAVITKITSRTSITSTIGVTLISDIGR